MLGIGTDVLNITYTVANVTGNITQVTEPIKAFTGHWGLLIGAVILIVGFFLFLKFLKNIIANVIIGIIGLLILKFVLGIPVPLTNPLVILIVAVTGIPGLAVVMLAIFFGLL